MLRVEMVGFTDRVFGFSHNDAARSLSRRERDRVRAAGSYSLRSPSGRDRMKGRLAATKATMSRAATLEVMTIPGG